MILDDSNKKKVFIPVASQLDRHRSKTQHKIESLFFRSKTREKGAEQKADFINLK